MAAPNNLDSMRHISTHLPTEYTAVATRIGGHRSQQVILHWAAACLPDHVGEEACGCDRQSSIAGQRGAAQALLKAQRHG